MALEPEDNKKKNNLLSIESKLAKTRLSNGEKSCLLHFLEEAAVLINCQLPEFNGHVTLHIQDGELTSWKSNARGSYKK